MSASRAARLIRANAELRRLLNRLDHPDTAALPPHEYSALRQRALRWAAIVERLITEPHRGRAGVALPAAASYRNGSRAA